jgi:hypothetical protein
LGVGKVVGVVLHIHSTVSELVAVSVEKVLFDKLQASKQLTACRSIALELIVVKL